MKIISKFKDFYDYKVAKYGVDEKLVYTRKTYCEYFHNFTIKENSRISEDDFNKNLKEDIEYFKGANYHKILIVGEKLLHLFFTENGIYSLFDIKKLEELKEPYKYWYSYKNIKKIIFNDGKEFEIYTAFRYVWNDFFAYDRKKLLSHIKPIKNFMNNFFTYERKKY